MSVKDQKVVTLEEMLNTGQLHYDFDDVWARGLTISVPKHSRLGKTFGELGCLFDLLMKEKGNTCLKLKFTVVRLRLANALLSRLLRDLIKRCRLHLDLIGKQKQVSTNTSNISYVHNDRVSSLLKEIELLKLKESALYKHLKEAIDVYWTNSEVHAIEKALYNLQEKKDCKMLEEKLHRLKEELMGYSGSTGIELSVSSDTPLYPLGSEAGSQVEVCSIPVESIVSGDEVMVVEKALDAAALPWYLSNELLVVLSLVIVGCGIYLFLNKKGRDDDPGSGSSGSGLSAFRGLVDLLRVINEEEREEERRRDWWDLNAVKRFAAFNNIIIYGRAEEEQTSRKLSWYHDAHLSALFYLYTLWIQRRGSGCY